MKGREGEARCRGGVVKERWHGGDGYDGGMGMGGVKEARAWEGAVICKGGVEA